ncbi:MAG: PIN domain nuclease [Hyphomicrobiaceae bacterium]
MIMVDSGVWIDFFNGAKHSHVELLADLINDDQALIGDLVLTEVLQGYRSDREFELARQWLEVVPLRTISGRELAVAAASNYRFLRAKGITVRKTIDVLIGTWCIVNQTPLLHSDRDFDPLEQHLGLQVWRG